MTRAAILLAVCLIVPAVLTALFVMGYLADHRKIELKNGGLRD